LSLRRLLFSSLFPYTTLFRSPFILDHDSLVVVTSGRNTVKGMVLDNRYGEYFSDNFRFYKGVLGWEIVEDDDGFDINNTELAEGDRKSTRLNSSHVKISYADF